MCLLGKEREKKERNEEEIKKEEKEKRTEVAAGDRPTIGGLATAEAPPGKGARG